MCFGVRGVSYTTCTLINLKPISSNVFRLRTALLPLAQCIYTVLVLAHIAISYGAHN